MATTMTGEVQDLAPNFPSESTALARYVAPTVALQSPTEIAAAMAQFDGEQFMAEVAGQAMERWFYSFSIQGKTVEGVSAKGAHEFARLRAEQGLPIRFPTDSVRLEEATENGVLGMRATVTARDHRSGMEGIGMAFYPHMETKRDGTQTFDRMAGRKALAVAERNAILRLIPEQHIVVALKLRAQIVERNKALADEQQKALIASRPQAPRVTSGEARQPRDPYSGQREQSLSGPGAMPMPFGRSKGTPIGELPTEDLQGAIAWAREKGKFAEFVEAAGVVLADRESGEPALPLAG